MRNRYQLSLVCVLLIVCCAAFADEAAAPEKPKTPSEFLGFTVGADRVLADYHQISDYMNALAASSGGRMVTLNLGKTTLGNDFQMVVISSSENIKNVAHYKEIAKKIADPRGLTQDQINALAHEGKSIVLVTCNIHSSEIGASQMAMEWAYQLVTAQDPTTLKRLNDVILLLVPSLNPDGQIMETEWYRKYVGTKYEGVRNPFIYHHYVGHDNNRDWYMLTQKETRMLNQAVYHEWFPQVWIDEHQMGSNGPRIFVPPNADPVANTVNPVIFRGINLLGTNMAWRLEEQKKSGVIYNYSFDAYWPGATRNTGWWKNVFGVLTETASARMATPIEVAPTELAGGGKGLVDYHRQINFPNPWPGGIWRLRDIMDYELIVSNATLEIASNYREDFLRGVATMAMDAVKGGNTPGFDQYWMIDTGSAQNDPVVATRLAYLMREHNVEVYWQPHGVLGRFYIPIYQPYGKFVEEMFSVQRYPEVRPVAGGGILPPYDVAAWSLPLMMGVKVEKTAVMVPTNGKPKLLSDGEEFWPNGSFLHDDPLGIDKKYCIPPNLNSRSSFLNEYLSAGGKASLVIPSQGDSFLGCVQIDENSSTTALAKKYHVTVIQLRKKQVTLSPIHSPRVGLYKSYTGNIDEGWTRWVLEQYGFAPKTIENKAMRAGGLHDSFDVIVLPDMTTAAILEGNRVQTGRYSEELPPEYMGGIGREGVKALHDFVDAGGTLITLAGSSDIIPEAFNIPVRNALARTGGAAAGGSQGTGTQGGLGGGDEVSIPGSLLRINLDVNHPVNYGMPKEAAAFVDAPMAFATSTPPAGVKRTVLAWYPADEQDILVSGWIKGADKLENKAAAVAFEVGKGKIVMFGFRVQHRAQTEGTFKMLFNAIWWGATE